MSVPEIEREMQEFCRKVYGEPVLSRDDAVDVCLTALDRQRREILAVLAQWDDALPASLDYSTAIDFIESRFGREEAPHDPA